MDGSLFDRMLLMVGRSRRSAVRTLLAGSAVAAAGTLHDGFEGRAKKNKKRKTCPECKTCPTCPECPVVPTCKATRPGDMCAANIDCCTADTNYICGFREGLGPVCCGALDAECLTDDDCCNSYSCLVGACKPNITC
ncbi:MAG: hypothetical protein JNM64_16205 [Chloroflexia bacterium]|nr:hypothetical protein [Chloroflexia bacterium]